MLTRLRAMRDSAHVTNKDISEGTGIPESTINKIFTGVTKEPTLSKISAIVHFLGFTLDDLCEKKASIDIYDEQKNRLLANYEKLNESAKKVLAKYSDFMVSQPENLKSEISLNKIDA